MERLREYRHDRRGSTASAAATNVLKIEHKWNMVDMVALDEDAVLPALGTGNLWTLECRTSSNASRC
jgi:hypothetical protein